MNFGSEIIPFLNLQYWFCIIATWFGKVCSVDGYLLGVPDVDIDVDGAVNAATTTIHSGGGFWSWLWPFGSGSSATDVGAASSGSGVGFFSGIFNAMPEFVQTAILAIGAVFGFLWTVFSWISYSASGLLALVILGGLAALALIRMREWDAYGTLPPGELRASQSFSRWQDLLNEAMSTEPKRWREAILAADGLLGVLLTRLGYHGATVAEQMRSVPEDAFVTVPAAWEAHRVRNFVAAKSTDFILTQREAFRVMKLYEQVFEEFDFI